MTPRIKKGRRALASADLVIRAIRPDIRSLQIQLVDFRIRHGISKLRTQGVAAVQKHGDHPDPKANDGGRQHHPIDGHGTLGVQGEFLEELGHGTFLWSWVRRLRA